MRAFAAILLSMGLAASPVFAANDAKDSAKEDLPVAVSSVKAPAEAAKAENSVIENQLEDLRSLIETQMQELQEQRAALKSQQLKMEALEEKLRTTEAPAPSPVSTAISREPASVTLAPVSVSVARPAQGAAAAEEKPSPLSFKIGAADFFPLGFMDLTSITRTTQLGGIGTNFGSVAFNNSVAGRLTEERLSVQNSRIGLRTEANFGQAHVTGYLEADFLGYQPANANDTSNSNTLRMRLYWADYRRGKFEVLGGQSWSFLTPNRNGLGALPADLFYSQDVDTNYQLGLTWGRVGGVRFIVHPNSNWAIGLALENPEQTLPSSVVVPAAFGAGYTSQFDSNSSNTSSATGVNNPNTPNLHPDVILKTAFDAMPAGHHVHFDVAGLFRTFKAVNLFATPSSITQANTVTTTSHGGGVAATANVELIKNLRFITTAFYSVGGGRYIASTAGPDVIITPNGQLSSIRAGSGISGFEYQPNAKTVLYGYYSGAYFGRDDNLVGGTFTGYGFPNQSFSSSGNRYLYEPTIGIHYMMWRNPNYGDLRLMTQYSYVSRTPWSVVGGPHTAHTSMVYIDLRYDLP